MTAAPVSCILRSELRFYLCGRSPMHLCFSKTSSQQGSSKAQDYQRSPGTAAAATFSTPALQPNASTGRLGAVLGPSWSHLGATWGRLGASFGGLGAILGALGATWGRLGASLCALWAILVPSWGHLGDLEGNLEAIFNLS